MIITTYLSSRFKNNRFKKINQNIQVKNFKKSICSKELFFALEFYNYGQKIIRNFAYRCW